MDWCSVYLTPQGLPKYIYLSLPLIFPTTSNGIRTKNRPVWITPGAAPIRWMGPIRSPRWEQKRTEGYVIVSRWFCFWEWRSHYYEIISLQRGQSSAEYHFLRLIIINKRLCKFENEHKTYTNIKIKDILITEHSLKHQCHCYKTRSFTGKAYYHRIVSFFTVLSAFMTCHRVCN
jgi:hypothetical protein